MWQIMAYRSANSTLGACERPVRDKDTVIRFESEFYARLLAKALNQETKSPNVSYAAVEE